MEVIVNNVLCIFTIKNGNIYILADDNKIPCIVCSDKIDVINKNYVDRLNLPNLNLKQTYTFSEKKDDKLIFYILFNDILNYDLVKDKELILIDEIDDNKFINKSMTYLKDNIVSTKNLIKIFDSEFALPELQKLLENILNTKFDRRNFRKKLLNQNIIEQIDKIEDKNFGRPAKLYKFKDDIKNIKVI